jgi:hypothetical protein
MAAIYWFAASKVNPKTRQPMNYPPGIIERFVLGHPGSMQDVMSWVRSQNLGSPGVHYMVEEIPTNKLIAHPVIMAWQINMGSAQVGPSQPAMSGQHIQGGQPMGGPHSQGNEPGGMAGDYSGFETLPGAALDGATDGFWAPNDDGTVDDLINEGGALRQQKRGS